MIILHQPRPAWGLPNMSPFCVKLETYLRMAKLEYKIKGGYPGKSPNRRIPYVNLDGKLIGDSSAIISELKKRFGDSLDEKLTPEQKAQALALQSLLEDRLYYLIAYLRWSDEESWQHVKKVLSPLMPPVVGSVLLKAIRRFFLKDFQAHATGDLSREDRVNRSKEAITAVSHLLGDKAYYLGSEPSSVDATLYGFLIQVIWVPWGGEVVEHARSLKNLTAYCERMKARYWS